MGFAPPRLLARKGHPLADTTPEWADILGYPMVRLHIPDAPDALAFAARESAFVRHFELVEPVLRTQHISTALEVVRATNCIFPGPPFFIQQQDLSSEVITLPLPDGEELMMKFVIVYHQRIGQSPAHRYLLAEIVAAVEHYRLRYGLPDLEQMRKIRSLDY